MSRKFLFILMLLFFTINLFGECTKDTDCKGDRICEKGECVFSESKDKIGENSSEKQTKKEFNIWELKNKSLDYEKAARGLKNSAIILLIFGGAMGIAGGIVAGVYDPLIAAGFLVAGPLLIIGGIVCVALYPSYKRKSDKYKNQLEEMMKKSALFKNEKIIVQIPQPVIVHSKIGNYYGLSLSVSFM